MASVDFLKQFDPDHSMSMLEKDETGKILYHVLVAPPYFPSARFKTNLYAHALLSDSQCLIRKQ